MHKLAIVISASKSDDLLITVEDLQDAEAALKGVEDSRKKVFSYVGQSSDAQSTDVLLEFVRSRKTVSLEEAYREVHKFFPKHTDFTAVVQGLVGAGLVELKAEADGPKLNSTAN